ncbi:unnamed protein product [Pedinophyceae sp. YPF-701]|nr:unnamed protein product [Pedinophyceae sp. YPF-701]
MRVNLGACFGGGSRRASVEHARHPRRSTTASLDALGERLTKSSDGTVSLDGSATVLAACGRGDTTMAMAQEPKRCSDPSVQPGALTAPLQDAQLHFARSAPQPKACASSLRKAAILRSASQRTGAWHMRQASQAQLLATLEALGDDAVDARGRRTVKPATLRATHPARTPARRGAAKEVESFDDVMHLLRTGS